MKVGSGVSVGVGVHVGVEVGVLVEVGVPVGGRVRVGGSNGGVEVGNTNSGKVGVTGFIQAGV